MNGVAHQEDKKTFSFLSTFSRYPRRAKAKNMYSFKDIEDVNSDDDIAKPTFQPRLNSMFGRTRTKTSDSSSSTITSSSSTKTSNQSDSKRQRQQTILIDPLPHPNNTKMPEESKRRKRGNGKEDSQFIDDSDNDVLEGQEDEIVDNGKKKRKRKVPPIVDGTKPKGMIKFCKVFEDYSTGDGFFSLTHIFYFGPQVYQRGSIVITLVCPWSVRSSVVRL